MTYLERLGASLKGLLSSQKVITAITGILSILLAKYFAPDLVGYIVTIVSALLVGQGAADLGKNAAKINVEALSSVSPSQIKDPDENPGT